MPDTYQGEHYYKKLGEKIASFEVNGFLSKEEVAPFKKIVDKFKMIGYIVVAASLVIYFSVTVIQ